MFVLVAILVAVALGERRTSLLASLQQLNNYNTIVEKRKSDIVRVEQTPINHDANELLYECINDDLKYMVEDYVMLGLFDESLCNNNNNKYNKLNMITLGDISSWFEKGLNEQIILDYSQFTLNWLANRYKMGKTFTDICENNDIKGNLKFNLIKMKECIKDIQTENNLVPLNYRDIQIGVKLAAYIFIDGGIGVLVDIEGEGQFYGWGQIGFTECLYADIHLDIGEYSHSTEIFFNEIALGYTLQNITNTTINARFTGIQELVNLDFSPRTNLDLRGWQWGQPQCIDTETWGVQKNWVIDNFTSSYNYM